MIYRVIFDNIKYSISDRGYYSVDELMVDKPKLFQGCHNSRAYIKKHKISEKQFIFSRKVDDEWVKSDGTNNKFDKVFMSAWFCHDILQIFCS